MSTPELPPPRRRVRIPDGLVTALFVAGVLAAAGVASRRLGLGGTPQGGWLLPLAVASLGSATAWFAYVGASTERVVVALLAAVVGALLGGWVATQTPPSPGELRQRLEGMAGPQLSVESVSVNGNARCAPCASADAVLLTSASTVDEPLVRVLTALRRAGIASLLQASSTRPEEITAAGAGDHLRWSVRGVPEKDAKGVLRERVLVHVVAH